MCDLYYVIVHVIHRSHVNINYVTTHAPPTGDRPRQNEHRRQRSDKSAEHRVERPVIRGHFASFGLIQPWPLAYVISSTSPPSAVSAN